MIKSSFVALLLPVLLVPAVAQTPTQDTYLQVTTDAVCGGNTLPSEPSTAAIEIALSILIPQLYLQRSAGCVAGGTPVKQLCVSYYSAITSNVAGEIAGFELLPADQIHTACGMPMETCASSICVEAIANARNLVKTNCTDWNHCN